MGTHRRLALRIAYLGGGFAGWQIQAGRRTIQGELQRVLSGLFGAALVVHGAGRTDAGVHAAGQVAHCDVPFMMPPAGARAALNSLLGEDVRVLRAWYAPPDFDARRSARARLYTYRIAWGRPLPPWEMLRTWLVPQPLSREATTSAAAILPGEHDFAALALSGHSGTGRRGTRRTINSIRVGGRGRRMTITVDGDAFLRAMVRRIVGALAEIGRGARGEEWLRALLDDPSTRPPAPTAPAKGLTLTRVRYAPPAQARSRKRPC